MCSALQGYTGSTCAELQNHSCGGLRCLNGGSCLHHNGQPLCQCPPGFSGHLCENEQRCSVTCHNGGTCVKDPANPFQHSCRCPPLFSGHFCEKRASLSPPTCPDPQCEHLSGDKVCDNQCNNHQCQWDGGDCSLSCLQPWVNCTASVPCWDLFQNGRCDQECNNAACLFDSFECQQAPPSVCEYVGVLSLSAAASGRANVLLLQVRQIL